MESKFRKKYKRQTLIQELQNILRQYPDDSQILKELIQNAEDAGAKEVKFLYDDRQWGTEKLLAPEWKQFQGAALYAYNDACFTEEDWDGVLRLGTSNKAEDALKVGRFGLGFRSVFHLTDLPGILSGKTASFHDPNEFSGGEIWDIPLIEEYTKNQKFFEEKYDQFAVFNQHLCGVTESTMKESGYGHTLFRFPLRTEASPLTDTIYDEKKVEKLFQMFQGEGHLVLLFMKSIEKIQLYKKGEEIYCIQLAEDIREKLRIKKKEFLQNLSFVQWMNQPQHMIDILDMEIKCNGETSSKAKWLVCQYFAGGDGFSSELKELCKKTKNLPWVGVAFSLDDEETRKNIPYTDGHVFCVLPLPLEEKGMSGLPFHVNGYFAVDHNRRHLKWPSVDQDLMKCDDKDLLWNQCLLKEVLPKALVQLVREAVRLQNMGTISVVDVYRLIPDIDKLVQHWKPIQVPFFTELFKEVDIFHTGANTNKTWFKWNEVWFVQKQDNEIAAILTNILATSKKKKVPTATLR